MAFTKLFKKILRRPHFNGQDRIFNFLYSQKMLQKGDEIVAPIVGNFNIKCNTDTWIGAKIAYNGDYEPTLKRVFREKINQGDTILDIGANIGFHTLYFAELTGPQGKVIAFEPVPINFERLKFNIALNPFKNIFLKNIALGNKNEQLTISADENSTNPGAYNLFDQNGDVIIHCFIGDEVIDEDKIDFIKIDVEGYESFVVDGLIKTIQKSLPKIVFEYDQNYHLKTSLAKDFIFTLLKPLNYTFFAITIDGLKEIDDINSIKSANILAIPHIS